MSAVVICEPLYRQRMIWDFTTYSQRRLYKFSTCILSTRSEDDRVEVYLDEIATAAFEAERRVIHHLGLEAKKVPDACDLVVLMIAEAVVHEWLHHEAHLEEKAARFASEQLYQAFLETASPCFARMGRPRSGSLSPRDPTHRNPSGRFGFITIDARSSRAR